MAHLLMPFPSTKISSDADSANYENYLAWQAQTQRRRRLSQTQFSLYQCRSAERTSNQVAYKEEAVRDQENLKELVERRLSRACDCESCESIIPEKLEERRGSDATSTRSERSLSTLTSQSSRGSVESPPPPAGTVVRGPTSPSSKNSLITSPPPRSRHHHRRRAGTAPE